MRRGNTIGKAKRMPLYEHVFLARQDISSQQVDALIETFGAVITDAGGSISKNEYWGLKNLAFKIKKNRKAHFTLLNIEAPAPAVKEMERQMGISTDVIRFLTLRVDEHEAGPSPMMKRGDRDERRGGRRDRDGGFRDRDDRFRDRDGPRGRDRDRDESRGRDRDRDDRERQPRAAAAEAKED
jgi:small subunit ribosomal protein S6